MPKPQSLRTLVDQFVSDLSARVREVALATVHAALGAGPAPKRRGPGRPRGPGKRGPGRPPKVAARVAKAAGRIRRSSADLEQTAAKVLAYVRSNAGQGIEQIGKGLRTATAELKRPIQVMVAAGKLRTEGQKRGTKYFAGGRGKAKAGRKATRKTTKRAKRGKARGRRKSARVAARTTKPAAKKARRKLSPEQRAALVERLAKARAARLGPG